MEFFIGDIVRMKKQHPCGCYEWKILRVGMDFRIECIKCGRQVMLPRSKFEKGYKKTVSSTTIRSAESNCENSVETASPVVNDKRK